MFNINYSRAEVEKVAICIYNKEDNTSTLYIITK